MTDSTKTAPIPSGRYGAPDPAPNTPTECPRCGAPAISREGVAKHTLHHRQEDVDRKRQKELLDRLERFLDGIENTVDAETGKRLSLPEWIEQTDDLLDSLSGTAVDSAELRAALEEVGRIREALEKAPAAPPEAPAPHIIAWPEDLDAFPDVEQEASAPDDRDAALARSAAELGGDEIVDGVPLPAEEPDEDDFEGVAEAARAAHDNADEPIGWGRP